MTEMNIRELACARLNGRFDKTKKGLPMNWTASGFEVRVKGSFFDVELECDYRVYRPYVSIEVDGLRAQTLAPLKGRHTYTAFCGLDASKAHEVKLILETQLFPGDGFLTVWNVKTDGEFLAPAERKRKIEFIGDSITSGEGGRGPLDFQEWVPMMFSASDNYARFVSDRMNAQYQAVSQSGWGIMSAWNNDPACRIPRIYEMIAADNTEYDFSFDPDYVVIALGTNDQNALAQPEFENPVTHEKFRLTKERMPEWIENACAFLKTVHEKNPRAKIVWTAFFKEGEIQESIQKAVALSKDAGIPVSYVCSLDLANQPRGGMGSRSHPGLISQKHIARALVKALRAK